MLISRICARLLPYLGVGIKGAVSIPDLTSVAVEINSFCNRKCRLCPNFNHIREKAFLDEELFYKIVGELEGMKFKGDFTFNLFNEPLLDERLCKFIEYVRKKLPSARITLNTNGDFLNLPLWKEIRRAGLDFANVTQYDGKINDNIKKLMNEIGSEDKKHIYVHQLDYICNRAGLIETDKHRRLPLLKRFCSRPFRELCINYKGKVVLCCNDYLDLVEIGDLRFESIQAIWRNRIFKHYRKKLFFMSRSKLALCDKCDMYN